MPKRGRSTPHLELRKAAELPRPHSARVCPNVDAFGNANVCYELEHYRAAPSLTRTVALYRHTGSAWTLLAEVPEVGLVAPRAETLPDGDILLAGRYSVRQPDGFADLNGLVVGDDGSARRRFLLGDGIEDVQATTDGNIWVSYDDQGTMGDFGTRGWGRIDVDTWIRPMGVAGLVCFTAQGVRLLEYTPPRGFLVMNDCFAMNVMGEEAWASYHPKFPIVRVRADGSVTAWHTGLPAANAILAGGDRILVFFLADTQRCWLARLGDSTLTDVVAVELRAPDDVFGSIRWVMGRGTFLHVFTRTDWFRADASQLLAGAS